MLVYSSNKGEKIKETLIKHLKETLPSQDHIRCPQNMTQLLSFLMPWTKMRWDLDDHISLTNIYRVVSYLKRTKIKKKNQICFNFFINKSGLHWRNAAGSEDNNELHKKIIVVWYNIKSKIRLFFPWGSELNLKEKQKHIKDDNGQHSQQRRKTFSKLQCNCFKEWQLH